MKDEFSSYSETFILESLNPFDANQLHLFISENSERLKRYLPVTLSSNSTLEKTKEYITSKSKEIEEKINFTFTIRDKVNQQLAGLIILKRLIGIKNKENLPIVLVHNLKEKV